MENVRVVFITIPTGKAEEMAKGLVQSRMAACVNITPKVKSYYWSGDKVESAEESMLIVKTTHQKIEDLTGYVILHHPYAVPEVITVQVAEGLPKYIDWIIDEMGK